MRRRCELRQAGAAILGMACGLLIVSGTARADCDHTGDSPIRKLGRGLANTATGVLELPIKMIHVGREDGPIAGATLGTLKGLKAAVIRTWAGVVDAVTFPIGWPNDGHPMVSPEFLFQGDDDEDEDEDENSEDACCRMKSTACPHAKPQQESSLEDEPHHTP